MPQENKTVLQEVSEESTAQSSEPVGSNIDTPASVKGCWFCSKCGSYNEDTALCNDCGSEKE